MVSDITQGLQVMVVAQEKSPATAMPGLLLQLAVY